MTQTSMCDVVMTNADDLLRRFPHSNFESLKFRSSISKLQQNEIVVHSQISFAIAIATLNDNKVSMTYLRICRIDRSEI